MFRCYAHCTCTDLPNTELDNHNYNVIPIIHFHVHQKITRCTLHVLHHLNENKQYQLCEASYDSIVTEKLYT